MLLLVFIATEITVLWKVRSHSSSQAGMYWWNIMHTPPEQWCLAATTERHIQKHSKFQSQITYLLACSQKHANNTVPNHFDPF